jgi:hypothetical protein
MPAGPSIILPCKRVEIWALAIDRTDGGVEAVSANRIVALFAISLLGVRRRVLNVESHKNVAPTVEDLPDVKHDSRDDTKQGPE